MLWVESEPGNGSTFHFTVRFRLPTGAHEKAESTLQLEWEGLPVLAVDDNLTNRRILKEMLANLGIKPALAELGIAAYLSKPISQAEFLEAIAGALSSSHKKPSERALATKHYVKE